MSKRKKRLQKLRNSSKDVSFDELRSVLEDYGFELQNIVGSHYTFRVMIDGNPHLLVIPFRRPIKPIYIKKALKLIDKIEENEIEDFEHEDNTGEDA